MDVLETDDAVSIPVAEYESDASTQRMIELIGKNMINRIENK